MKADGEVKIAYFDNSGRDDNAAGGRIAFLKGWAHAS